MNLPRPKNLTVLTEFSPKTDFLLGLARSAITNFVEGLGRQLLRPPGPISVRLA
jgi:hypothetical protein